MKGKEEQKFPQDVNVQDNKSAPSWVNQDEILQILKYLKDITEFSKDFKYETIGIITTFRYQIQQIKGTIHSMILGKENINLYPEVKDLHELKLIKVGLVEQFQGQERDIIIISCVRSLPDEL